LFTRAIKTDLYHLLYAKFLEPPFKYDIKESLSEVKDGERNNSTGLVYLRDT
jgi:hypothetical protein